MLGSRVPDMNIRLKRLAGAATLALALSGLAACGSDDGNTGTDNPTNSGAPSLDLISDGTLTVCSDVPYPPFEDFDTGAPTGFKGFDVDIISEIAQKLGLQLVIKDSDFNALKSGLAVKTNQCDLIASAMSIKPERQKVMAFSDGYYNSSQSLLVPTDSSITSIADLAGKKVAAQKGTTGYDYATANATGADIIEYNDDGAMWAALKAGQVDAILQDLPVNIDHQNDAREAGKFHVVETYETAEEYGFAMKLDNTGLVTAVDDELATMRDNGDYQTIFDNYFGKK